VTARDASETDEGDRTPWRRVLADVFDVAAALTRAQKVAGRLDEVTDTLNAVIAQAENRIAGLRLGVPGRILLARTVDGESFSDSYVTNLVFTKDDGEWRLMVESGYEAMPGSPQKWSYTPILNTNRSTRLSAVDKLPDLVEDMIKRAESEVTEVEEKLAAALTFVKTLPEREP
jgi:hypothetical protein